MLPNPENMGLAGGFLLLSCIQSEIYVMSYLLPVMAALFNFSLVRTSSSVCSSPVVFSSSDNFDIAGEISLLSCMQDEMHVIYFLLPVNSDHV